jgi:hypothetical protein
MGSVHKFKRPPRNEQQFRGYRPGLPEGQGRGKPPRWRLRDWQKTILAWAALVLAAGAVWLIGRIFG